MMQKYLFLTFVYTLLCIDPLAGDFFWRDYNGTIPNDAFPGGRLNDTTTYIGGINVEAPHFVDTMDFVSATIIPGDITGYAVYLEGVALNQTGVKILCSSDHTRLQWVKTMVPDNCSLVRGSDTVVWWSHFIGLGVHEGQLVTGRVSQVYKMLHAPWLEKPYRRVNIKQYEQLVHC